MVHFGEDEIFQLMWIYSTTSTLATEPNPARSTKMRGCNEINDQLRKTCLLLRVAQLLLFTEQLQMMMMIMDGTFPNDALCEATPYLK